MPRRRKTSARRRLAARGGALCMLRRSFLRRDLRRRCFSGKLNTKKLKKLIRINAPCRADAAKAPAAGEAGENPARSRHRVGRKGKGIFRLRPQSDRRARSISWFTMDRPCVFCKGPFGPQDSRALPQGRAPRGRRAGRTAGALPLQTLLRPIFCLSPLSAPSPAVLPGPCGNRRQDVFGLSLLLQKAALLIPKSAAFIILIYPHEEETI